MKNNIRYSSYVDYSVPSVIKYFISFYLVIFVVKSILLE